MKYIFQNSFNDGDSRRVSTKVWYSSISESKSTKSIL